MTKDEYREKALEIHLRLHNDSMTVLSMIPYRVEEILRYILYAEIPKCIHKDSNASRERYVECWSADASKYGYTYNVEDNIESRLYAINYITKNYRQTCGGYSNTGVIEVSDALHKYLLYGWVYVNLKNEKHIIK